MFQIYLSGAFRLDWILQVPKHILLPQKNRLGLEHDIKCQKVMEQSFLKATEGKWRSYRFLYNEDVSWKKKKNNSGVIVLNVFHTFLNTHLVGTCCTRNCPSDGLSGICCQQASDTLTSGCVTPDTRGCETVRVLEVSSPWILPSPDAVWIPETSLETGPSYPSCEWDHMKGDRHPKWQLASS